MSSCGYSGLVLGMPCRDNCTGVDVAVSAIHEHIVRAKLVPPVMVAHSFGSFLAQKYIESYPVAGLVLVSPLPPSDSTGAFQRLLQQHHLQQEQEQEVGAGTGAGSGCGCLRAMGSGSLRGAWDVHIEKRQCLS